MIHFLSNTDYHALFTPEEYHWWGLPRGFCYGKGAEHIWINRDAYFIDNRDLNLLIAHEEGHLKGLKHAIFGVMAAYGIIRYLTTFNVS